MAVTATQVSTARSFPAEDVYIHTHGTRLHYQVAGPPSAPPLVLLHGIGGCVNWWTETLPVLTPHFRTYALDLPGFGHSWRMRRLYSIERLADYLYNWLEVIGLEEIYLLGHSLGGQVSARFAAKYPGRVKQLVLVAPSGLWPTTRERLNWFVQAPRVKVPFRQVMTIATGTMRTDALALFNSIGSIVLDGEKAAGSLEKLTMPTLVIWGTADSILPPVLASRVVSHLKHAPARLELIENGTHDVMFDQAETFNRITLDFLLNGK